VFDAVYGVVQTQVLFVCSLQSALTKRILPDRIELATLRQRQGVVQPAAHLAEQSLWVVAHSQFGGSLVGEHPVALVADFGRVAHRVLVHLLCVQRLLVVGVVSAAYHAPVLQHHHTLPLAQRLVRDRLPEVDFSPFCALPARPGHALLIVVLTLEEESFPRLDAYERPSHFYVGDLEVVAHEIVVGYEALDV